MHGTEGEPGCQGSGMVTIRLATETETPHQPRQTHKHTNYACLILYNSGKTMPHLIADSRVRAPAAHARPATAAVVPAEHEVERAGAHHAPRSHRVWHPELLVCHLVWKVHGQQQRKGETNSSQPVRTRSAGQHTETKNITPCAFEYRAYYA